MTNLVLQNHDTLQNQPTCLRPIRFLQAQKWPTPRRCRGELFRPLFKRAFFYVAKCSTARSHTSPSSVETITSPLERRCRSLNRFKHARARGKADDQVILSSARKSMDAEVPCPGCGGYDAHPARSTSVLLLRGLTDQFNPPFTNRMDWSLKKVRSHRCISGRLSFFESRWTRRVWHPFVPAHACEIHLL